MDPIAEAEAELEAEVADNIHPSIKTLADLNIDTAQFTSNAIAAATFCTSEHFLKTVRVFTSLSSRELRVMLLEDVGIERGFFVSAESITILQFFRFCTFLRTSPGQKALQHVQRRHKLQKQAIKGHTVADAVIAKVLASQICEWNAHKNRLRKSEDATEILYGMFEPGSDFTEPSFEEMCRLCYEEYEAEAKSEGKAAMPAEEGGLALALQMCREKVKQKLLVEFAKKPGNMERIELFLNRKIVHFVSVYNRRQEVKYRSYLVMIGGKEVVPADLVDIDGVVSGDSLSGSKRKRQQ